MRSSASAWDRSYQGRRLALVACTRQNEHVNTERGVPEVT
jgi:hypothetical protein